MTETKLFKQTKEEYFRLIMKVQFKKKWWVLAIFMLFAVYSLIKDFGTPGGMLWWILIIGYPLFVYFYLRRFAYSKKNKIFFEERKMFFDEEKMKLELIDGTTDILPYKNIIEVKSMEKYWMLYITQGQFIYVPKNIFFNGNDQAAFQKYISQ
jgi:hypothetical protein